MSVEEARWLFVLGIVGEGRLLLLGFLWDVGQAKLAKLRPSMNEKFLAIEVAIGDSSEKCCKRL